jgi:hypothetical protein
VNFDQQIRQVLERALTALSGHLEEDLSRFAQDLMRVAGEERHRATVAAADAAAAEVRRQTEGHVLELRQRFEQQLEDLRRAAQQQLDQSRAQPQVGDVGREMTAELEQNRLRLEAQEEEMRRVLAEIDRAHAEVEAAERASQVAAEELASAQRAASQAQAEVERTRTEAVERARTDAHQAELAAADRLVEAIRALDDERSLGGVLDGLAECAGRETERVAVMVVKSQRLRGWRLSGFGDAGPPTSIDLDFDAAGLPGVVVRTRVAVSRFIPDADQDEDTRQPGLPPFAAGVGPRHALGVPVLVAGHAVAVLYADAPQLATPAASPWPATLEVLARHAGRVLEAMTMEQATGLSPGRHVARASHTVVPAPVGDGQSDDFHAARH